MTRSHPWWVVVGSAIALIVGNGPILQFTFGVFLKPVAAEFGTDRGTMSLALLLGLALTALALPVAGRLVDRYGVRRVTLPAIVLTALSVATLALAGSITSFILLYGLLGVASAGQTPLPYARAVASAVDERRGLALGVAMAGVGIGAVLLPQFAQALVSAHGWRWSYVGLGILVAVIAFPAVALLVREGQGEQRGGAALQGATTGEALRTPIFWVLAAAFFLATLAGAGVVAHLVPLLTDRGVTPARAVLAISVSGAAVIVGRILSGLMLDRLPAPRVALCFFVIQVAGVLLLLVQVSVPSAVVAAMFIGLSLGAEVDLIAYMISRWFGMRAFGTLYGSLFSVFVLASGIGPVVMGAVYQASGRYGGALVAFTGALATSCVLMLWLERHVARGPQGGPSTAIR